MKTRYTIPKVNNKWPRKALHIIPSLINEYAFNHNLVGNFWDYMIYRYKPRYNLVLITPCSNVKPYPLSPMNLKIRAILKRHRLWDPNNNRPLLDWLFLSDLLGFVPYTHTWIPPACCYDVPPDVVEKNDTLYRKVKSIVRETWRRIHVYYEKALVYLPRRYYKLMPEDYGNPSMIHIKYNLFSTRELEKIVASIIDSVIR